MPTGDTLAVIGLAITAMIGALTVSGGRAKLLWCLTAVFALFAVGYAGLFSAMGITFPTLGQWVTPLIAPVTVGVVALMLREKPTSGDSEDNTAALKEISSAIETADWQGLQVPHPSAVAALAVLNSAFTSVWKRYGIPAPKLTQPNAQSLEHGVAFLRCIRPYLRAGHVAEAKKAAGEFKYP